MEWHEAEEWGYFSNIQVNTLFLQKRDRTPPYSCYLSFTEDQGPGLSAMSVSRQAIFHHNLPQSFAHGSSAIHLVICYNFASWGSTHTKRCASVQKYKSSPGWRCQQHPHPLLLSSRECLPTHPAAPLDVGLVKLFMFIQFHPWLARVQGTFSRLQSASLENCIKVVEEWHCANSKPIGLGGGSIHRWETDAKSKALYNCSSMHWGRGGGWNPIEILLSKANEKDAGWVPLSISECYQVVLLQTIRRAKK